MRQAAARGIPDGSTAVTCIIQAIGENGSDRSLHSDSGNGSGSSLDRDGGSGACGNRGGGGSKMERRLLVANLGDSRCVMVRADGSALALSSDHKPNRPDERARVQAAGGQVHCALCLLPQPTPFYPHRPPRAHCPTRTVGSPHVSPPSPRQTSRSYMLDAGECKATLRCLVHLETLTSNLMASLPHPSSQP